MISPALEAYKMFMECGEFNNTYPQGSKEWHEYENEKAKLQGWEDQTEMEIDNMGGEY